MEMMECMKTLAADAIIEGSKLYNKAIYLLKNDTNGTAFLTMQTIEGKLAWLHWTPYRK
jgi:hypothetical protein